MHGKRASDFVVPPSQSAVQAVPLASPTDAIPLPGGGGATTLMIITDDTVSPVFPPPRCVGADRDRKRNWLLDMDMENLDLKLIPFEGSILASFSQIGSVHNIRMRIAVKV